MCWRASELKVATRNITAGKLKGYKTRIRADSVAGRRLIGWGVTERELRRTWLFRWDRQKGGAITVALPFKRALILMRSKYLPTAERAAVRAAERIADSAGAAEVGGTGVELADGRHLSLVRHEFCHVAQLRRWGFAGYWLRHLRARVRSRSLLAAESDVEAPCYEAQRLAARDFE